MTHIGIIGGGNISETHARAARAIDGVRIAAIYGTNREKTERLAQLYGGTAFDSLQSFLDHKPMDLVMIGGPSGLHAEQGIAAARHGLRHIVIRSRLKSHAAHKVGVTGVAAK